MHAWLGGPATGLYAAALLPCAALALYVSRERVRILDNVRVFFLFLRQRRLRAFLVERRTHLEYELARLAQLAKRPAREAGGA